MNWVVWLLYNCQVAATRENVGLRTSDARHRNGYVNMIKERRQTGNAVGEGGGGGD